MSGRHCLHFSKFRGVKSTGVSVDTASAQHIFRGGTIVYGTQPRTASPRHFTQLKVPLCCFKGHCVQGHAQIVHVIATNDGTVSISDDTVSMAVASITERFVA